jgi:hypothetical protein
VRRDPIADELEERWMLAPSERLLLFTKTAPSGLGFVVLLKFFQAEGRFPYYPQPQEVPPAAIQYVAKQAGVDPADWWRYDWKERTIKNHRAEIRGLLGFREATAGDSETVMLWLQQHYIDNERRPERVKGAALARFRELRLEPPKPDRVDRLVRSAIANHEASLCGHVMERLPLDTRSRLQNLLQPISEGPGETEANQEESEGHIAQAPGGNRARRMACHRTRTRRGRPRTGKSPRLRSLRSRRFTRTAAD